MNVTRNLTLEPNDPHRLASLGGQVNGHIRQIEASLGVEISARGNLFSISGAEHAVQTGSRVIQELYAETAHSDLLTPDKVDLQLHQARMELEDQDQDQDQASSNSEDGETKSSSGEAFATPIRTRKETIRPRGANQNRYVSAIRENDINFGIGPAGTGKTYLAVACAVEALLQDKVERILLVRPAVEAGEKLGFLPGDLSQKVDPYLRPLYDALYEMLGFEAVSKLIQRNVIEVAPLAFMRGRTLNHAFIILDESQNTTVEQMKMFLTRIGFGSTAVVTGDVTQIDLPRGQMSGLIHCQQVLDEVSGISITRFKSRDVVRHPLVQRIVEAYDRYTPPTDGNSRD